MGLLISKTDFVGRFALPQSISDTITPYITEYEEKYLVDLLGASLFTLFEASVVSSVPTGVYLTIYNPIAEDYNYAVLRSRGIKNMLLDFVRWEYIIGTRDKMTDSGLVVSTNENVVNVDYSATSLYPKYNAAVNDWNTIQWYINQHLSDYSTFNGQPKMLSYSI